MEIERDELPVRNEKDAQNPILRKEDIQRA
jgi:hypothetical protein